MRDDRILPATRALALVIFPILVVAFCVLYPVPTDTALLFAWEIKPTMTPMVLASAYIGGAWFFFRTWRAAEWHTTKAGFVPVALFAGSLGLATVLHWQKFNHDHVAFWLWCGLYFTTPVLVVAVFLRNNAVEPVRGPDELRLSAPVRIFIGLAGAAALSLGLFLWIVPLRAMEVWPWTLTPLTARVMGSVMLLGVAGLMVYADPRWTSARLILQVEQIMIALILLAAARAHAQLDTGRPLTWLLGAGLSTLLAGSVALDRTMRRRTAGPALRGER
jgi:hypothetical protein